MQSLDAILQCHGNNYLRHFLRLAIFIYSAKSQHKFYVFSDVAFKDAKKVYRFLLHMKCQKVTFFSGNSVQKTFLMDMIFSLLMVEAGKHAFSLAYLKSTKSEMKANGNTGLMKFALKF